MTIKHNLIIFIFLTYFSFILSKYQESDKEAPKNGKDYPGITCGKKDPKKPKDCTKYGTDSGMLCCWVSGSRESSSGLCTLLSTNKADNMNIDGETLFKSGENNNYYWNCGNKSIFLNICILLNIVLLFLSLL